MATGLDMSLDDIIKQNKLSGTRASGGIRGRRRAGRGGAGAGGGSRSGGAGTSSAAANPPRISRQAAAATRSGGVVPAGIAVRALRNVPGVMTAGISKPTRGVTAAMDVDGQWQHDLFDSSLVEIKTQPAKSLQTGTKLLISNLDYGVSEDDIKDLFSDVGDLKRATLHYDKAGRSKGTAEVVFARKDDALKAVKRYNNVMLDGKPMSIELVANTVATAATTAAAINPLAAQLNAARAAVRPMNTRYVQYSMAPLTTVGRPGRMVRQAAPATRGRTRGGPSGGRRGGGTPRGRGRGGGRRESRPKVSAEDLDKDLDSYHDANNMET